MVTHGISPSISLCLHAVGVAILPNSSCLIMFLLDYRYTVSSLYGEKHVSEVSGAFAKEKKLEYRKLENKIEVLDCIASSDKWNIRVAT